MKKVKNTIVEVDQEVGKEITIISKEIIILEEIKMILIKMMNIVDESRINSIN